MDSEERVVHVLLTERGFTVITVIERRRKH